MTHYQGPRNKCRDTYALIELTMASLDPEKQLVFQKHRCVFDFVVVFVFCKSFALNFAQIRMSSS